MGGRETIRGILFQTLVCCVQMFDKDWYQLHFDPDKIENKTCEKVDILFTNAKKQTYALQVKSSINDFTVSKIQTWLNDLKNDIKADFYELHLVGSCNSKAYEFIKEFSSKNEKIICSQFDVDIFETQVLDNIKKLLTQKKIGYVENNLTDRIKVLCYEILKTAIDYNTFTYDNIMEIVIACDNQDVRDFCELIKNRLSTRIDLILEFYNNTYSLFGFGTKASISTLSSSVKKIREIDSDYNIKINEALNEITKNDVFIRFLCNEYIHQEKLSISSFLDGLNIPQHYYHQMFKKTYHLYLREQINILISKYNEIDKKISNKYNLQLTPKIPFEDQDDLIIFYKDNIELKYELSKLIFDKEEKYASVLVFTDDKNKLSCIGSNFSENCISLEVSTNFSEEQMYEYIVSTNEAFTKDGSFSPQLHMRYIVFIFRMSNQIKLKLGEFKNRATIKYIFAEQSLQ